MLKFCTTRRIALVALAALLPVASVPAWAQAWPEKPIRIVVGFAPGGFTDVLARWIGQKLLERLGQPVIVENKPGAAGTLGADLVAKSKPDGYTLLLGHSNSNAVAPALYSKLPYDALRDFTPIVRVATTPMLLTVHAGMSVKDVQSFVALARSKPNGLTFASSGSGSAQHLAAARFMLATRTTMTHVPYKGSGQAIVDLLSGNVDLNFESPPNVLPHYKAGKVKVLAITSAKRSPLLPEVPTLAEAGVSNAEMQQWFAVMGPPGMPPAIVQKLNVEINAILKHPETLDKINSQGGDIIGGSSKDFTDFLVKDIAAWAHLVQDANIHLD